MEVYCPECRAMVDMVVLGVTFPWGFEFICRCSDCQSKFVVDVDNQTILWLVDPSLIDKERASYNRRMVANEWYIEGYLAIEQWLEENPYAEWREPGGRYERSGGSFHEQALGKSGVDCPEKRKEHQF